MNEIRLKKSVLIGYLKIFLITVIIIESDGFITHMMGLDRILAAWSFAGLMTCCSILAICAWFLSNKKTGLLFFLPLIAFVCVFIVSAGSALFIFPKRMADWLPSLYPFTLIFFFYFLYLVRATARDVAVSFTFVAVIISLILFLDQLIGFTVLDSYKRMSSFDIYSRRIVILKNEVVLGLMFLFAYTASSLKVRYKEALLFGLFGLMLYLQVTIMESRLAVSAVIVGCGVILYFNRKMRKTHAFAFVGMVVAIATVPLWLDAAAGIAHKATNYDANIGVRFETISFMFDLYKRSYGWGVGMMSPTGTENNVLSVISGYNFADGGAFATIFQFGLGGLIIWVGYTVLILKIFKDRFESVTTERYIPLACFAFLLGFTLNPLPLNFFLQPWTILVGGALVYFAWLSPPHSQ